VAFALVGGLATAAHVGLALLANTRLDAPPMIANLVGYVGAVLVSYAGNARITFRRRVFDRAQFLRFSTVSLAGLGLGQAMTYIATEAMGLPFQFALAAVVVIVPAFTFAASRLWAFAVATESKPAPRDT
jgi:putative flippase GtrA